MDIPLFVGGDDHHLGVEFVQHLTAGAARRASIARHYRYRFDLAIARGDQLKDRCALGADGEAVRGVLHIAAGVDDARIGEQRRAYMVEVG